MDKLGDKIHKLRKQAGLSQEELAFRVDVTRQTVSLWESNSLMPKSDKLKLLCEIFKVSFDYFLFDDEREITIECNEEVVSSDATDTENIDIKVNDVLVKKDKYRIVKIFTAILIVSILLIVTLICIMRLTTPSNGVETVTSISFYFDPKIMLGLVIGCFIIFIISGILLIYSVVKVRKK